MCRTPSRTVTGRVAAFVIIILTGPATPPLTSTNTAARRYHRPACPKRPIMRGVVHGHAVTVSCGR
jgi:hypothetical protein